MNIYVITKGEYDGYNIVAVRTNEHLASQEVVKLNAKDAPHFDGDEYRVETYDTEEQIEILKEPPVTISTVELEDLREAANKLAALEAAGVDNWEGYDHAMAILRESNDE